MGGSFQDYSWIQGFEADFPYRKSASKSWIREIMIASLINFQIILNTFNYLNMKL